MTKIEYVASRLSEEELLCQIAEEASELAQAALKRRRAITQHNPTPASPETVMNDLCEEYADLLNAMNAYITKLNIIPIGGNMSKLERWANRLKEKENNHEN